MNFKDGQGEDETNETNGRFPVGFRSFSSVSLFSFVSSSLLRLSWRFVHWYWGLHLRDHNLIDL
jgi:hypothetical protein